MPYRIAGIDVHKKMLAVVVADVEIDGDFHFDRQKVGTTPADLRGLADWLVAQDVEEVVMESTAQYWRPVWEALEQHWRPRCNNAHLVGSRAWSKCDRVNKRDIIHTSRRVSTVPIARRRSSRRNRW